MRDRAEPLAPLRADTQCRNHEWQRAISVVARADITDADLENAFGSKAKPSPTCRLLPTVSTMPSIGNVSSSCAKPPVLSNRTLRAVPMGEFENGVPTAAE
jgi:hypothetical protein